MKKNLQCLLLVCVSIFSQTTLIAQNVFSGEPVQVVGTFNGFTTTPYGADYRTTTYRKITTTTGNPNDGRGQWKTTINVQASGGDVTPVNMLGGASGGFLFISGPSSNRFNNKWNFNGIGQGAVNGINAVIRRDNTGGGQDMGLNMGTAGYYTFIFNDAGYVNSSFYVAYTNAAPINVTRNSQVLNPDGTATIGITSSTTPSAQENIFVRYTLGSDFSGTGTSSVVQASGSGTSYSAIIPSQANGTSVRYFLFSSTQTLSQLNAATEFNRNLSAISVDDNGGANYLYASVLPVKISSFKGTKSSKMNVLSWTTEVEINVDRYEIQRSPDASNFKTIAVRQANNISISNSYELNDNDPLERNNYYRLKIIDNDGKENFSKIILLTNKKDIAVSVYPNPAVDKIQAEIPNDVVGAFEVVVINLKGQVLFNKKFNNIGATSTLAIPLPKTFTKGTYILKIVGTNNSYKGSFLVL